MTKKDREAQTHSASARGDKTSVDKASVGKSGAGKAGATAVVDASCDVGHGGRATAVDPEIKKKNLARLRRIEGQVRGLHAMVEQDRYCADILTQISSVHEALRAVARELMRNHLKHCASAAIQRGATDADAMYDELIDLMHKHSR